MSWVRIPSLTPLARGLRPLAFAVRCPAGLASAVMSQLTTLLERWRDDLAAWAIPEPISLPLASRTTALTAVDTDAQMLALLAERAEPMGFASRMVSGRWPDVAGQIDPADVVTCHHVTYNVPGIEPFITALTSHAHRRVVVEMATVHPLSS